MRLLWSIHLYPPTHNCGSEHVAHNLNKYLISQGHHVRVILHQAKMHNVEVPYTYEGVEVFPASGRVDAYQWADVIFTHLDYSQFTIIMAMSAKRPLVHFVHNDIQYHSVMNAVKCQYVVYNSDWIKDKISYHWPGVTLHPPCDTNQYRVDNSDAEAITLISLNKNKGGEIFYRIAEAMPDKKFIGVRGSYDEQIIKHLPNVELVPNSPDILSVYRRTRILIMPSQYESWGRTATEAMCSGIPVICTPTPGLKENCGDAAIYVGFPLEESDPGEPQVYRGSTEEWVEAIRRLDDPVEYKKYSLLCRQRAEQLNPQAELEKVHQFIMAAADRGWQ